MFYHHISRLSYDALCCRSFASHHEPPPQVAQAYPQFCSSASLIVEYSTSSMPTPRAKKLRVDVFVVVDPRPISLWPL